VIHSDALYFTFYTIIVLFYCLHHTSLLFLSETITIPVDGMSYCLFDLGLDVQLSWYLAISKYLAFQLYVGGQ